MLTGRVEFSDATDQAKLRGIVRWWGYKPKVHTFSLPSGWTCPFALDCLSKADRHTGKITDGKDTEYRCFSATDEARSSNARKQRWRNFDALRHLDTDAMADILEASLPSDCEICRAHVGGDFFNQAYFDAWMEVARRRPNVLFYAYTKSIPYWIASRADIPDNFILNGSKGGRADNLLHEYSLKVAEVVFSLEEADAKGLEIDHDESHAMRDTGNFALLIHGTQPKGSNAQAHIRALKRDGYKYSYSRS